MLGVQLTPESVELGCIPMLGQRISVRIVTVEFLTTQKVWKCKYEVISKGSKHYGLVDILFSDALLAAGHSYYLQLNRGQGNPRVLRVFHEIVSEMRHAAGDERPGHPTAR